MKLTKSQLKQIIQEEANKELTRSQLEKIIKEETVNEFGAELGGYIGSGSPGGHARTMARAAEAERTEDWTSDMKRIAKVFEAARLGKLVARLINKKDEFMDLIAYFVGELVEQDKKREIQIMRKVLTDLMKSIQAGEGEGEKKKEEPAATPPEPEKSAEPEATTATTAPVDPMHRQAQKFRKKHGLVTMDPSKLTGLEEIIREETIKILMQEVEPGGFKKGIKSVGDFLRKGVDKLTMRGAIPRRLLSPDVGKVRKRFEQTKLKAMIKQYIDRPDEFHHLMIYLMSFIEDISYRTKAGYFREFIARWQERVEKEATAAGVPPEAAAAAAGGEAAATDVPPEAGGEVAATTAATAGAAKAAAATATTAPVDPMHRLAQKIGPKPIVYPPVDIGKPKTRMKQIGGPEKAPPPPPPSAPTRAARQRPPLAPPSVSVVPFESPPEPEKSKKRTTPWRGRRSIPAADAAPVAGGGHWGPRRRKRNAKKK